MISNLGLISETVSGIYNKTLTRTYTTAFGKGKVLSMSIGNVNNYTYDYDTYGRLNKIATPAGDFIYTRPSDSDLVTAMACPNGVNSTWSFEEHRNLLAQVANGSVSTYAYTNDALGRRTNVTRSGSAFSDTNILTYGYNSRSEVISALSNINANYSFSYNYDPIGNRLNSTLAGTAWSYTSNNLNQYTALTSGNTTQSPAYDADGNMTFRDGWTQIWNGENRLVEMYNDTAKLTFSYDYMGRRIEKKVFQKTGGIWAPQKSLQYVYDGYKLVEEINTLPDEKPVIRRYTWQPESQGADLPLVVTDVASNQSYFYTADGNKNISELVDAAGNIAAHYEYDPFGKINTQNGAYAANNPFRFSSEYFDDETGLVYYNYRYYSPQMGRWINRDPIQEKGGWNLYAMVGNNTINRKDRLGNMVTPISEPIECTKILSQLDARYKAFDRAKARRSIFNDDWTNILLETSEFSPLSLPELGAFLMDKARELLSGQLLSLGFAHPDPLIDLVQDTIIGTMLSGPLKELLNNAGMNTFPNEPCRNALHELGINMELYAKAETLRAWWENWENFTSAYKEICPCTTDTESDVS